MTHATRFSGRCAALTRTLTFTSMLTLALALALGLAFAAPAARAQGSDKSEIEAVKRAVHVCASCHGDGGISQNKLYPSLAGQQRDYTIRQLKDFRNQKRHETDIQAYMWGISALLTDEVIEGLADFYAQQPPRPPHATQPRAEAAGRKLYMNGLPDKGVRACVACHGENAEGAAGFPRLAGLSQDYVVRQLRAFRNTPLRPHGVIMKAEVAALTPAQMNALGAYLQSR